MKVPAESALLPPRAGAALPKGLVAGSEWPLAPLGQPQAPGSPSEGFSLRVGAQPLARGHMPPTGTLD